MRSLHIDPRSGSCIQSRALSFIRQRAGAVILQPLNFINTHYPLFPHTFQVQAAMAQEMLDVDRPGCFNQVWWIQPDMELVTATKKGRTSGDHVVGPGPSW